MEADSTTYDCNTKHKSNESDLPFPTSPGNLSFYEELSNNDGQKHLEVQLVERLQDLGLLPKAVKCPTDKPDCNVVCKKARVIDRVQWVCEGCGKRQPIRTGSFFLRVQSSLLQALKMVLAWCEDADCTSAGLYFVQWVCEGCGKRQPIRTGSFFLRVQSSLLQALKMVLAWCEDADCTSAGLYFDVKPRVATAIYDRLDDIAVKVQKKRLLGGDGSVVMVEVYPDCMTRLSPDTTDQPHVHRILMLADTNHIPTSYQLHVIKNDLKKMSNGSNNHSLIMEIEKTLAEVVLPESLIVCGSNMPHIEGTVTLQQLAEHCDADMQNFLSTRIWRQALTLCVASRDTCAHGGAATAATAATGQCAGAATPATGQCAGAVQRYLHTALYRIRFGDGFYQHTLQELANEYAEDGSVQ